MVVSSLVYKGHFQELNKRLLISNDSYLRTTSALHKETSQRLWQICADQGDIFLGKYEVRPEEKRTVYCMTERKLCFRGSCDF